MIGSSWTHEGLRGVLRAHVVVLGAIPTLATRTLGRILVTALCILRILMLRWATIIRELEPSYVAYQIVYVDYFMKLWHNKQGFP